MGARKRAAGLTVQREQIERAAKDLHDLANDITAAIDTLPKSASRGTRAMLEQHARRAKAIAGALIVEVAEPDPQVVGLLLKARGAVAVAVIMALGAVGGGVAEAIGEDGWTILKDKAEQIVADPDASSEDRQLPPGFGSLLRRLRTEHNYSQFDLADHSKVTQSQVSQWERGAALPEDEEVVNRLIKALHLDQGDDIKDGVRLRRAWSVARQVASRSEFPD
jgi:DNA-binding transcriptional regulator YiaG